MLGFFGVMRLFLLSCAVVLASSVFACAANSDSIAGDRDLGGDDDDGSSGSPTGSSSGRRSSGNSGTVSSSSGGGSSGGSGSSSSSGGSIPTGDLTDTVSGEATFYNVDLGDQGNCSLPCPSTYLVAALNTADYEGSAMCGGCARVEGPDGEVVVQIWDRCPGCGVHGIDLSRTAFGKISPLSAGRIDVSWAMVRCPWQDPIEYQVFSDRIQIRNHRVPIEKVEIKRTGAYTELSRRSDNFFTGSIADSPFTVRLTGATGEVLEEQLEGRGTQQGTQQFVE